MMLVTLDVEQMLQNALQQEQQLVSELERMQANLLGLRGQLALLTSIKQQAEAQQQAEVLSSEAENQS